MSVYAMDRSTSSENARKVQRKPHNLLPFFLDMDRSIMYTFDSGPLHLTVVFTVAPGVLISCTVYVCFSLIEPHRVSGGKT